MFAPQGITALDEAEDGMGVNVVGEGAAECGDEGVRGTDMEPGEFGFEEVAIEDAAAEMLWSREYLG